MKPAALRLLVAVSVVVVEVVEVVLVVVVVAVVLVVPPPADRAGPGGPACSPPVRGDCAAGLRRACGSLRPAGRPRAFRPDGEGGSEVC